MLMLVTAECTANHDIAEIVWATIRIDNAGVSYRYSKDFRFPRDRLVWTDEAPCHSCNCLMERLHAQMHINTSREIEASLNWSIDRHLEFYPDHSPAPLTKLLPLCSVPSSVTVISNRITAISNAASAH